MAPKMILATFPVIPQMSGRSRFTDRKSTRLKSSHTDIYTLALHDALPISEHAGAYAISAHDDGAEDDFGDLSGDSKDVRQIAVHRSEEHTSEIQSHRYLHSCPTRRSSDLRARRRLRNKRPRRWRRR